ncbi:MAG TPA: hypothetical protein VIT21_05645 [Chthoniobacterales bacterium]
MSRTNPNILVIWGDDISLSNISYSTRGLMGYRTPNIERIAKEGWQKTNVTIATGLKSLGYATEQVGKNHRGDREEDAETRRAKGTPFTMWIRRAGFPAP